MSGIFFFTISTQLLVATVLIPWRWFFLKGCTRLWDMSTSTVLHNLDNFVTEWFSFKYLSIYKEITYTLKLVNQGTSLLFLLYIGYTSKSGIILTLQISIFFFLSVTSFVFHTKLNRCCVTLDGDHYCIRPSQIDYLGEHTLMSLLS